ncbi:hypothetical protein F2Q68_00011899 [Brassica cretica]|uniref:Uncharacterized protein n=1 Tax=Brassica cretica TaxID=69181 RepID=A0A8S9KUI3_BRACR|nr:hypothetical protein F2Q68_00011899 [Brassica cretica]
MQPQPQNQRSQMVSQNHMNHDNEQNIASSFSYPTSVIHDQFHMPQSVTATSSDHSMIDEGNLWGSLWSLNDEDRPHRFGGGWGQRTAADISEKFNGDRIEAPPCGSGEYNYNGFYTGAQGVPDPSSDVRNPRATPARYLFLVRDSIRQLASDDQGIPDQATKDVRDSIEATRSIPARVPFVSSSRLNSFGGSIQQSSKVKRIRVVQETGWKGKGALPLQPYPHTDPSWPLIQTEASKPSISPHTPACTRTLKINFLSS